MKKSKLWCGLIFTGLGLILLPAGFLLNTALSGLICGWGGAMLASGLSQLLRYWKWSRPENAEAYRERLEQERISLRDERKEMLRNRSGRCAYLLGMALCSASIVVFSVLGALGLVEGGRLIVLLLGGYLVIQYAAGVFFYRRLEKKY